MISRRLACLFSLLFVASSGTAFAANEKLPLVNGVAISQAKIDFVAKDAAKQGQPDSAALRDQIKDNLISNEIVFQEAMKQGTDKSPDVLTEVDMAKQTIIVRTFLNNYAKAHPISNEALKAEYDRLKSSLGSTEYKARHILVEKEADAKEIIAQLKKGAKFDKLAMEKSKDQGSQKQGGDLGWNVPSAFVPAFSDAMTKLAKGQVTQTPVRSHFGWHVIKLDDSRPLKTPGFDEVKSGVEQRLQREQIAQYVKSLRDKAKVE